MTVRRNVAVKAEILSEANAAAKENGLKQIEFVNAAISLATYDEGHISAVVKHHVAISCLEKEINNKIGKMTNEQMEKVAAMLESGDL